MLCPECSGYMEWMEDTDIDDKGYKSYWECNECNIIAIKVYEL